MGVSPLPELRLFRRTGELAGVVLFDEADAVTVGGHGWSVRGEYAVSNDKPRTRMHRLIVSAPPGVEVDHINGNKLDNRRANLRLATRRENGQNLRSRGGTSRYRGVSWHKASGKWRAGTRLAGKAYHLGCFTSEDEAGAVAAAFFAAHMPYSPEARGEAAGA
jgi:hypothetical protein